MCSCWKTENKNNNRIEPASLIGIRALNPSAGHDDTLPKSQWLTNKDGCHLHILYYEPKARSASIDDTAIFFIHGVCGCAAIWKDQMMFFAQQKYHVYAIDFVGHGKSDKPKEKSLYHFTSLCDDSELFFDTFKRRRNIVVAHSYGTAIALWLSCSRRQLVQKLVLISGGGPYPMAPENPNISSCCYSCLMPIFTVHFLRKGFSRKSSHVKNKIISFDTPGYVLNYIMAGQDWMECNQAFHSSVRQPTLVMHGTDDMFEKLEETRLTAQSIPNCRFWEIPDSGHMCMMERPILTSELIDRFISESQRDLTMADKNNSNGAVSRAETPCSPKPDESHVDMSKITKSLPSLRLF